VALRGTIRKWAGFYRKHASVRPSGSAGVLIGRSMHVRRPGGRNLEATLSLTADTSPPTRARTRAVLGVFNPWQNASLTQSLPLPLYCAGISPGTAVSVALVMAGTGWWAGANAGDVLHST
jgi:hypothetical protein